jgi:hypothetical protein
LPSPMKPICISVTSAGVDRAPYSEATRLLVGQST